MHCLALSSDERKQTEALLDSILQGRSAIQLDPFLSEAVIQSHKLPERIRRFLYSFKLRESTGGVLIRQNPLDEESVGPTPSELRPPGMLEIATREIVLHVLYACQLGEPFAWNSIQDGYIVNDIMPIRANSDKPISSGSLKLFDFHTEDAFHVCAGDYLGLMCMRNPDRVPTIISTLGGIELDAKTKHILFQPRFLVRPNIAHHVNSSGERVSILFGDPSRPYIRLNLNASAGLENDDEAREALHILIDGLRKNATEVVLNAGDCFYLDNFRSVHARGAYTPRYDGTDRWLKRLYITGNLRKSRALRASPESRLVMSA
jgi:Fe(II)/alpha-ketoglutarate-dependent arginine beta-hydroxylase